MNDAAQNIPIAKILEPSSLLRLVHKDSVEYLEMRDSIAQHGLWNSVSVRTAKFDAACFEIIDGLYRFTICKELRWQTIPCIVKHGITDDDVLAAQIQANAIRPETKPTEFASQIKRMLTLRPEMTIGELAHTIHKSPTWVSHILGVLRLAPDMQKALDRGEVPLQSAYMLSTLPRTLQLEYLDRAKTMPAREFKMLAAGVKKQFYEAIKQGCMDVFYAKGTQPVAYLRALKEVQGEYEARSLGGLIVTREGCRTALDGFYTALQWVLHLDKESVEALKQKHIRQQRRQPKREDGAV